jgi:hypothetical protein
MYATLLKERRMHFTGYTTLDRKSGEAERSAVLPRSPQQLGTIFYNEYGEI